MRWVVYRIGVFIVLRYRERIAGAWRHSGEFNTYMRQGMKPTEAVDCDKNYWGTRNG